MRESIKYLKSLKDLNAAALDMKRGITLYNNYRLLRNGLNGWKIGLNFIMMQSLKKEIADTYRKKLLLSKWL